MVCQARADGDEGTTARTLARLGTVSVDKELWRGPGEKEHFNMRELSLQKANATSVGASRRFAAST